MKDNNFIKTIWYIELQDIKPEIKQILGLSIFDKFDFPYKTCFITISRNTLYDKIS